MKLALSNLCLPNENDYEKLRDAHNLHVECVFSRLRPDAIAVQALLYGVPKDLTWKSPAFINIVKNRLIEIKEKLSKKHYIPVVFGSPSLRNVENIEEKIQLVELLYKLNSEEGRELFLCVENIPSAYGTNTYNTFYSVQQDKLPATWDIGNSFLEKEEIPFHPKHFLQHVHISAPNLAPISSIKDPKYLHYIKKALSSLAHSGYTGYISIEMLPCSYEQANSSVIVVKELLNVLYNP